MSCCIPLCGLSGTCVVVLSSEGILCIPHFLYFTQPGFATSELAGCLQAEVAKKRENMSGIRGLVPEISKRAKTAFIEVGLSSKVAAVERVSADFLPSPLYVLYSNFCHMKAASGTDFKVRIHNHDSPSVLAMGCM